MSIYTKTGDKGQTVLYNGRSVSKADVQIDAYGSVDELTCFLGLIISKVKKEDKIFLTEVQKDLYIIMGFLAGKKTSLVNLETRINYFEQSIDKITLKLPKLNRFILTQGSELSSWFHVLRAVCRRAEREVVRFFKSKKGLYKNQYVLVIKYLNRLSDLFFTLARLYNKEKELII